MNYTKRDIEKAIRLKIEGYNWIATNKNGSPFAYGRMPYRCADDSNEYNIWDNQPGTPWLMLSKEYFKSITWENEPVYIDEIITGGKVQANGDTAIERLTAENAALRERLDKAVELKAKAGDVIYMPWKYDGNAAVATLRIIDIHFRNSRFVYITNLVSDSVIYLAKYKYGIFRNEDFDSIVFTDRSEAEARLAELKGSRE